MPEPPVFSSAAAGEMSELVFTKLQPPLSHHDILRRPRLLELFDSHREAKLIFIHAPAGFGKTTLITDWLQQADLPFSWLSIDAGDDDEKVFLRYLTASCARIDAEIGRSAARLLDGSQAVRVKTIITLLINDLALYPGECVIILDDYHLIHNPAIHDAVDLLLARLPVNAHLVIASRSRPPLAIATLRARRQLLEIGADDLRFSHEEAATFLREMMGVTLSAKTIAELETHTEGWIAGIQLAALSARGQDDLDSVFTNYSGDSYIEEYLLDEVMRLQADSVRDFLIRTSFLDRLCSSLCNTVTGRNDSHEILTDLERGSLFTFSLDNQREWFAYHHLFAQFLQKRLLASGEDAAALYRLAAGWYYDHGYVSQAIDHALRGEDFDRAGAWIGQVAVQMVLRGEGYRVDAWMKSLPETIIQADPRLCLARAWSNIAGDQGALDEAQAILNDINNRFTIAEPALVTDIMILQSYLHRLYGNAADCMVLSNRVLERLDPVKDSLTYGFVVINLSEGYRLSGDLAGWDAYLGKVLAEQGNTRDPAMLYYLITSHALLLMARAELHEAAAIWQKGISGPDSQDIPIASLAYTHLSRIQYEWNQLETARSLVEKGLAIASESDYVHSLWEGNTSYARILQALGDEQGALRVIDEAVRHSITAGSGWVTDEVKAYRAGICLQQGNMEEVLRWERDCGLRAEDVTRYQHFQKVPFMMLARLKIAQRSWQEADLILEVTGERARKRERFNFLVEIVTLQAFSQFLRGHTGKALDLIREIIPLVEQGGYVRTFLNEGPSMARMIDALAAAGSGHPYFQKLHQEFDDASLPLSLALSAREMEILRLMAEHLTSIEIADRLVISVNTARTHIKRIYEKLDAHSRSEALERAHERHLL